MSWLFKSGGQTTGASASATVFPMNIQNLFPLGSTSWISLKSKELSRMFSNTTIQQHEIFGTQPSLWSNSHICSWLLEKIKALTTLVSKVNSLLFNTQFRFVIVFLPRSNHPSTVILEPKKIKFVTASTISPSIYHEVIGPDAMIFVIFKINLFFNWNIIALHNLLFSV